MELTVKKHRLCVLGYSYVLLIILFNFISFHFSYVFTLKMYHTHSDSVNKIVYIPDKVLPQLITKSNLKYT